MEKQKIQIPEGFHDLAEKAKSYEIASDETKQEDCYHYPCLYFSGNESLKDLPKSGTALIHFKKVMEREEEITRGDEKKETYSVELQIHGIKPVDSERSTSDESEEPSDEDAIETGLEAASETEKNDD
jgi:hypothetical protein